MSSLRFKVVGEAFKKQPLEVKVPELRPNEYYACNVFNKESMYKYLPADVYKQIVDVMENGAIMERSLADKVADGMKKWAMDRGATHYSHWFQPLSGATAEKHTSFLSIDNSEDIEESLTIFSHLFPLIKRFPVEKIF